MLILLFKIQSRGVRTREEDLLSMLNFSSSSCGALQLINTNTILLIFFLYTAKITLSRTLFRALPFTLLTIFLFSFWFIFRDKLQEAVFYPIRPRPVSYTHLTLPTNREV